ncbi:MAG: HD domain-containing protein [Coriobacteriia bacterium]|nr:HD domain-containing protein [Coriobacteriia bacterium]
MRFQPFGRHLHNQIVIPLLAVSLCVAIVATVVGVFILQGLIEDWVGGNAEQAASTVRANLTDVARRLQLDAKLVSEQAAVKSGVEKGDWGAVERALATIRASIDVDDILLLDDKGVLAARVGALPLDIGSKPLSTDFERYAQMDMNYTTIMQLAGSDVIAAVRRITFETPTGLRTYTVVATRAITSEFLGANFRGTAAVVGFCDASGTPRARYVDRVAAGRPDRAMTDAEYDSLTAAISRVTPGIDDALGHPDTTVMFRVDGVDQQYAVRATRVTFTDDATAGVAHVALDPTGAVSYVFIVMSNAVAEDAGNATIGLITFWSVVAVLLLTGLGTIIARQVSAPLTTLSDSARRVAEGDFTARVEMQGMNEVAELAESFNSMTESLQERTETLTKKVLELATLYEMSRALGSTLDLDVLLDSVLDSALRIFNVDSGYVMLREKATGGLDLRAWRGMSGVRPDDRAVRSSMSEWVVRQGRPLIFNPPQDENAEEHVDSVTGALAALCVPLVSGEGVIGSISVGSRDRSYRFSSDDVRLLSTIANHVTIAIGNIELFLSLQEAYLATVRSLAAAVDAKDPYTRGHSDRVALYAKAIAERLELSGEQCTALEMAAYLHDIGKIGIREAILLKPGKLDAEEMGQMRHHPLIGANILRPVAFPWPIAPVVRHHHEHYDGQGYPAGLKGEEIPLLARILTVADAYEAMTADRPYRSGRDEEEAIEELHRCEGTHFDPRVVAVFVEALSEMEDQAAVRRARAVEEIQPEEARAIFVAICDGMFASFRRLGGPRLAANLEAKLEAWFREGTMPYSIHNGHLAVEWDKAGAAEQQLEDMREVIRRVSAGMEATAGRSLVDHFYDESVSALSDRMRYLALALDLFERM